MMVKKDLKTTPTRTRSISRKKEARLTDKNPKLSQKSKSQLIHPCRLQTLIQNRAWMEL